MAPSGPTVRLFVTFSLAVLAAAYAACGGDDPPAGPDGGNGGPPPSTVDTIPPAGIVDLTASNPGAGSIALQWVAPGDDGWDGTAHSYDMRYSTAAIDEGNWGDARRYADPPAPTSGGSVQVHRLTKLDANTTFCFAIKSTDEAENESELSALAWGTTGQEYAKPNPVTDLTAVAVDSLSFLLTWTATGDDGNEGTAAVYDMRYRRFSGVTESNWESSTQVDNETAPKPSGEPESLIVAVETPNAHHGFALKVGDEVPNWSEISNVCLALGGDSYLWSFPLEVKMGKELTVIYRAPGSQHVSVELHWGYTAGPCGQGDIVLFAGFPDEGTYTITYDFFDPETQSYHRLGTYWLIFCVAHEQVGTARVEFVN
jgi:hypothetical protein